MMLYVIANPTACLLSGEAISLSKKGLLRDPGKIAMALAMTVKGEI